MMLSLRTTDRIWLLAACLASLAGGPLLAASAGRIVKVEPHVKSVDILDAQGAVQREVPASEFAAALPTAVLERSPDGLLKIDYQGATVWVDSGQFSTDGAAVQVFTGGPNTSAVQKECAGSRGMAGNGDCK